MVVDKKFLDDNAKRIGELYDLRGKTTNQQLIKKINEKILIEVKKLERYMRNNKTNMIENLNYIFSDNRD